MSLNFKQIVSRLSFTAMASLIGALFALPLIWFIFAPFKCPGRAGTGNTRSIHTQKLYDCI